MRRINKQHSTNSMETSDLLKRVRQIEIKTRGLSNNIFAGQYHSAFKGKGMSTVNSAPKAVLCISGWGGVAVMPHR